MGYSGLYRTQHRVLRGKVVYVPETVWRDKLVYTRHTIECSEVKKSLCGEYSLEC